MRQLITPLALLALLGPFGSRDPFAISLCA
jgi:hypothetical protein